MTTSAITPTVLLHLTETVILPPNSPYNPIPIPNLYPDYNPKRYLNRAITITMPRYRARDRSNVCSYRVGSKV